MTTAQISLAYGYMQWGLLMLCVIAALVILMVIGVNWHDYRQRKKTKEAHAYIDGLYDYESGKCIDETAKMDRYQALPYKESINQ